MWAGKEEGKASTSFLKKRSKKLLFVWRPGGGNDPALTRRRVGFSPPTQAQNLHGAPSNLQKFFASFFQKRSASFVHYQSDKRAPLIPGHHAKP
jgi:hypothetical protein